MSRIQIRLMAFPKSMGIPPSAAKSDFRLRWGCAIFQADIGSHSQSDVKVIKPDKSIQYVTLEFPEPPGPFRASVTVTQTNAPRQLYLSYGTEVWENVTPAPMTILKLDKKDWTIQGIG